MPSNDHHRALGSRAASGRRRASVHLGHHEGDPRAPLDPTVEPWRDEDFFPPEPLPELASYEIQVVYPIRIVAESLDYAAALALSLAEQLGQPTAPSDVAARHLAEMGRPKVTLAFAH